ncbi:hypothetical protein C3473_27795 [Mycobacterium kansasii]|nr:hypothetical protein C3473_27795 [Mycobacterium kansasii]
MASGTTEPARAAGKAHAARAPEVIAGANGYQGGSSGSVIDVVRTGVGTTVGAVQGIDSIGPSIINGITNAVNGINATVAQSIHQFAVQAQASLLNAAGLSFLDGGTGNLGLLNFGNNNQGFLNFGSGNNGLLNFGDGNNGSFNFGSHNLGSLNVFGDYNIGNFNLGGSNLGSFNVGFNNFGSYNLGFNNIGDRNVGWVNYGDGNFGAQLWGSSMIGVGTLAFAL